MDCPKKVMDLSTLFILLCSSVQNRLTHHPDNEQHSSKLGYKQINLSPFFSFFLFFLSFYSYSGGIVTEFRVGIVRPFSSARP